MQWGNDKFWLAKTEPDEGFTVKVDNCARIVAGCQIKNMGMGAINNRATKDFLVRGSIHENGTWQTLVQDQFADTSEKIAPLLNITFEKPVEIQYLKFELISYWGSFGGGLQYFAAILATSKTQGKIDLRNESGRPMKVKVVGEVSEK